MAKSPTEKTLSALAGINKISTNIDGGMRLTLDFSENDLNLAQELLKIKYEDGRIVVAFQRIQNGE